MPNSLRDQIKLSEPAVVVPGRTSAVTPALMRRVVFVRRRDVTRPYSFGASHVVKASSFSDEEIGYTVDGLETGSGVHLLTGELVLLPNNLAAYNSLRNHMGGLFDMHAYYSDGYAESWPYISKDNQFESRKSIRYPEADTYLSKLGCRFKIKKTSGGDRRKITLVIQIYTFGSRVWKPNSESAFYAMYPNLDLGLTQQTDSTPVSNLVLAPSGKSLS